MKVVGMNPNTRRSQELRARRKDAGLVEVRGIWAPQEQHVRIKRQVRVMKAQDVCALMKPK